MPRRFTRALASLTAAALLAGCGLFDSGGDGRTELEFFQFKSEAIETFDGIIADFERAHPSIDIVQNHVPEADTAIRTRLVRGDVPDVMTLNANAAFGELARAGVFYNWADDPLVDTVSPAILDIINALGTGGQGEVNGLPFANNADGVIYNKQLFQQHGVAVPQTWDELIAAMEKFEAGGVTPIYATLKDQWTALPALNALASNLAPEDFWPRMNEDATTFREGWPTVAQRLEQLFSYAQDDKLSRAYDDGNQAFAKGEVAMYLQGSWAIPSIRGFEPDFEIGVFPLPTDDPAGTKLVSGVDVAVVLPREPTKEDAAMTFVKYLMRPEVVQRYVQEQSAIPALKDLEPTDESLKDLVPIFERGALVGFADHQIPPAIPLAPIAQQFLIDGDENGFLSTLDDEWAKFARRRD
jgi:raffinose/stachyose/melibiose transport system substrate-binding protein